MGAIELLFIIIIFGGIPDSPEPWPTAVAIEDSPEPFPTLGATLGATTDSPDPVPNP